MDLRKILTDKAPAPVGPYSQAIVADGVVYCSGQIAIDPATGGLVTGDIVAETHRVMENLGAVLAASGSSFDSVVKVTLYLKNLFDVTRVNEVYAGYFKGNPPARTTIGAAALPKGVNIEIDCIALVNR
jgi:2-iminobutanoate/2-iminopropanoate deaminase